MGTALALLLAVTGDVRAWGPLGHELVTRAALGSANELPAWFRDAADKLAELSNGPDRWRAFDQRVPALVARGPDHFFDLDVWGEERLPPERWAYVRRAARRHLVPEDIGFLPFAALEEYGELVSALHDTRAARPGGREAALAAAGVLAHLVGDAAVPLHVTRHHHGWLGNDRRGFTRDPGIHRWFESTLVAGVRVDEVRREMPAIAPLADPATAMAEALAASLALVPRVYETERRTRLEGDDGPARRLARARLAAGATLLARCWNEAWRAAGR